MAFDGWIEYNGTELVNLARTLRLARGMGVYNLTADPKKTSWFQEALTGTGFGIGYEGFGTGPFGGVDYSDITEAPWYDAGYPASAEFAGLVPLSFVGLDDNARTRDGTENTGDGGTSGVSRNGRLPIVAKVAVVGSTERGVEFGKRWMDSVLNDRGEATFCSGADLRYFRYGSEGSPKAHRRDVKLTRGTNVVSKRTGSCWAMWICTFTLTADDPYEYGEEFPVMAGLGGVVSGPGLLASGSVALVQASCPVYDYSPVYDPLYPALVSSPTAPDFYPAGWDITNGQTFDRFWARVSPIEPSNLRGVPVITLTSETEARMVRVSVWASDSPVEDQCGPLFSAVVMYLPPNQQFIIDGEQKAVYLWDGFSASVRRADSLVYGPDAVPVEWSAFNDPTSLLVTLDIFSDSDGMEGEGDVRASLAFVPKSD